MKNIATILTVLALFMLHSFANAQGNCPSDKIKVFKGGNGCGCHCLKECITSAELPVYLANGWNILGCYNCCKWKNWVDAGNKKTSIDDVRPNVEPGTVTIAFTLASEGEVKIEVADMTGRSVATVANEYREDLDNELIWDESALTPGLYMLTLEAGAHRDTKMISID